MAELIREVVIEAKPETIWPFLTAVATGAMFVGLVFTGWAFVYGSAAIGVCILGWFWPSKEPEPIHHPHELPAKAGRGPE